jgi:putative transposase
LLYEECSNVEENADKCTAEPRAEAGEREPPVADGERPFKKSTSNRKVSKSTIFQTIQALRGEYPIRWICAYWGVSASGYYAWLNRKESERYRQDKRLSRYIQVIHQRSRRIYGSPRITAVLQASGISVGCNRVARLMRRQQQLEGRLAPRLKGVAGARAAQAFYKRTPNRLLEGSLPKGINQVWVADYTYLRMGDRHIYYAVVMDLYSRRIVGTALSRHRDARMTSAALRRTIRLRLPQAGTIFHSDRGVEYSAGAIEGKRQMLQSMSRAANCYDNAHMESFFS